MSKISSLTSAYSTFLVIISLLCKVSVSAAAGYTVYPIPQSLQVSEGTVAYPTTVNIVADSMTPSIVIDRAREVLEENGITPTVSDRITDGTDLILSVNASGSLTDAYAMTRHLPRGVFADVPHHFDPHVLSLTPDADFIIIGDADGSAYYALASLQQILSQARPHAALTPFNIQDFSHTRYRGIVEGFYGHPFTMNSRLDILDYCKRYKLNFYLYAPKSDPYHTGNWRDPYPATVTDEERMMGQISSADLAVIADKARSCNVDFVWACHPSLNQSIDFNDLDPGVEQIISKFEQLHALGIRHFGVSIDDMPSHPLNQWELGHKVQTAVEKRFNHPSSHPADRVGNIVFVPTQYGLDFGTSALPGFSQANPNLELIFTGQGCWSHIQARPFDEFAAMTGRNPIMWWNNPVNDNLDDYLYMHGLSKRWRIAETRPIERMRGLLINPMNQGQASKITYFNAADYAWNPSAYDESSSWLAALSSIGRTPERTDALHDFILGMSSYAKRGKGPQPDNELYHPLYGQCRNALTDSTSTRFPELHSRMQLTLDACHTLREMADSPVEADRLFYTDIEPWLNKVEEQAAIIITSLDIIAGDASPATGRDLQARVEALHSDPRYRHSHLEGSGTRTRIEWSEVQPTPDSMDAFTAWLVGHIHDTPHQ